MNTFLKLLKCLIVFIISINSAHLFAQVQLEEGEDKSMEVLKIAGREVAEEGIREAIDQGVDAVQEKYISNLFLSIGVDVLQELNDIAAQMQQSIDIANSISGAGSDPELIARFKKDLDTQIKLVDDVTKEHIALSDNFDEVLEKYGYAEVVRIEKGVDFNKLDCNAKRGFVQKVLKNENEKQYAFRSYLNDFEANIQAFEEWGFELNENWEMSKDLHNLAVDFLSDKAMVGLFGSFVWNFHNGTKRISRHLSRAKNSFERDMKRLKGIYKNEKQSFDFLEEYLYSLKTWDPCKSENIDEVLSQNKVEKYIASHDEYLLIEVNGRLDTFTNISAQELNDPAKDKTVSDIAGSVLVPHFEIKGTNKSNNITAGGINLSGLQKVIIPKDIKEFRKLHTLPLISGMPTGKGANHHHPDGVYTFQIRGDYLVGKIIKYVNDKDGSQFVANAWFRVKLEGEKEAEVVLNNIASRNLDGYVWIEVNGVTDTFFIKSCKKIKTPKIFEEDVYHVRYAISASNENSRITKKSKIEGIDGAPINKIWLILYEDAQATKPFHDGLEHGGFFCLKFPNYNKENQSYAAYPTILNEESLRLRTQVHNRNLGREQSTQLSHQLYEKEREMLKSSWVELLKQKVIINEGVLQSEIKNYNLTYDCHEQYRNVSLDKYLISYKLQMSVNDIVTDKPHGAAVLYPSHFSNK